MSTTRIIAWLMVLVTVVALIVVWVENSKGEATTTSEVPATEQQVQTATAEELWLAPDPEKITDEAQRELVLYGKDLIAHTAKYLGPNGSVAQLTNGMNCQNCHLEAGTKPWGNNYGSVASTYPKFRARSGGMEDIYKRVSDCFERSLNGKAPDTNSREMQAIKAYIEFLGTNVKKGEKAPGSGLKEFAMLDRPADPARGKIVYEQKCQSCHQADGQGLKHPDGVEYLYPPLWGKNSYNDAAGLYRITNFAKYVKFNMPLGASHTMPLLTDEEAWDVAAFVNSQPRPHKKVPKDWPDISKKPVDHPFGPYKDTFSEQQHKFGPWQPIIAFYKDLEATSQKKQ
ncbi:hypothetical protein JCM31826_20210 [Thermaurantimonas aggregans]|uniref:Cytochrome c domain-containing protein n=1 Tax=Thermaurantimonas aggregans TaxID=2173829 RepID=A0A401XNE9_9FLAO|nr:c-type cytochrome [Thermaurantimonas aggregans]GCD78539.1 hypothetical protein JCM31826_20210 [Thermaurantimonas aggregans]